MSYISKFFDSLVTFLKTLSGFILDGVIYCLKFVLYLVMDGFFTAVQGILHVVDLSSLGINTLLSWSNMPPQLIYLINAAGIPQGITVLASAIMIRMALNLIPAAFTRI